MIPYNIINYPNPILKSVTEPITDFNNIGELVSSMFNTMYLSNGLGLAAPQIGISKQVFVIGYKKEYVFINPEILATEGEQYGKEGCLSFPGLFINKRRPNKVIIKAQNTNGEFFELTAEGLLARAILHENDHLHSTLLIDNIDKQELTKAKRILNVLKTNYKSK